ncbi:hypothetical protein K470DRAFT_213176, partial [Piedraia hortae CBS 480.64]
TIMGSQPTQSKFLSHATSLPVVQESIEIFKQNPYGQRTLALADGVWQKFVRPVEGYLYGPYSYVRPYVSMADEYADAGLGKVENRFPIVKEDTNTIMQQAKGAATWPYSYVASTWNVDEYEKTASYKSRGPGITTTALAVMSTELKIAADMFHLVNGWLTSKVDEAKQNPKEGGKRRKKRSEQQ